MKINHAIWAIASAVLVITGCAQQSSPSSSPLMTIKQYPITSKEEKTLDFFGTAVSDPYMWLENDTAANTEAWVNEQIALTSNYLDSIPFRQKILHRKRSPQ